jgi:hypothetical protein
LTSLAEQARSMLFTRIDSAFSLFIILVVVWLVQVFTLSSVNDPGISQA